MNWTSTRAWLGTVIRLGLAAIWLWAGASKLSDPRAFVQTVRLYDATPEWLSKGIGYGLPVLELCIGALLVLGLLTRAMAIISTVLLGIFLIGLIQAAARGIKLSCGCFGGGGSTASTQYTLDILRDCGLIVLAVFLILWPLTRLSYDEYLTRHDYVEPPSAKRMRSEQGQKKYNALLEARRREARTRTLYLTAGLSIVVVLVSVIGIGVQSGRAKIAGDLTAANATVANGVVLGGSAPVNVDIFEDFQCPICEQFEQSTGATLTSLQTGGKVNLRYHPIAILDSSSNGNRYSSRAANAAICASDIDVATFKKYHDLLFGKDKSGTTIQPPENGKGHTDTELIQYGKDIGIADDPTKSAAAAAAGTTGGVDLTTFTACVQAEQHKTLIEGMTDNASKRGVTGTPTILVDGKKVDNPSVSTVTAAVNAAVAKAPKTSPSATPKPSPSATP